PLRKLNQGADLQSPPRPASRVALGAPHGSSPRTVLPRPPRRCCPVGLLKRRSACEELFENLGGEAVDQIGKRQEQIALIERDERSSPHWIVHKEVFGIG